MTFSDYRAMIEDSPVNTLLATLRDANGQLVGACLADRLDDGLSAVYSFFDVAEPRRSLGTFMVLRLIETRLGRPEMPPKSWDFKGHFVQYEELQGPHKAAFNYRYLCVYEQPNSDTRQGSYGHPGPSCLEELAAGGDDAAGGEWAGRNLFFS